MESDQPSVLAGSGSTDRLLPTPGFLPFPSTILPRGPVGTVSIVHEASGMGPIVTDVNCLSTIPFLPALYTSWVLKCNCCFAPPCTKALTCPQVPSFCVKWRPLFWLCLLYTTLKSFMQPPSRVPFSHPYTPLHGGVVTTSTIPSFPPGICSSTHPLLLFWDLKEFHDQQIK